MRIRNRNHKGLHDPTQPMGQVTRYVTKTGAVSGITDYYTPEVNRTDVEWEHCVDEIHKGPPPYRSGGPFHKWTFHDGGTAWSKWYEFHTIYLKYTYVYRGYLHPVPNAATFDPNIIMDGTGPTTAMETAYGDPGVYASTCYDRYRPGQPGAQLAQFVAEIGDVPRMLRQTAKGFVHLWKELTSGTLRKKSKRYAGHYLNTQFGWLPFVNDVCKFYHVWKNADNMFQQLIRDNRQWIKRGGCLFEDEETTKTVWNSSSYSLRPGLPAIFFTRPAGRTDLFTTQYQKIWYSARYRYHIPNPGSVAWQAKTLAKMWGAWIDPATLWEITPFSWLVDWFYDVGSLLKDNDGLVQNLATKYAYVMGKTYTRYRTVHTMNLKYEDPLVLKFPFYVSRKSRKHASPKHFGPSVTGDLSSRQLSILGALGLSRLC